MAIQAFQKSRAQGFRRSQAQAFNDAGTVNGILFRLEQDCSLTPLRIDALGQPFSSLSRVAGIGVGQNSIWFTVSTLFSNQSFAFHYDFAGSQLGVVNFQQRPGAIVGHFSVTSDEGLGLEIEGDERIDLGSGLSFPGKIISITSAHEIEWTVLTIGSSRFAFEAGRGSRLLFFPSNSAFVFSLRLDAATRTLIFSTNLIDVSTGVLTQNSLENVVSGFLYAFNGTAMITCSHTLSGVSGNSFDLWSVVGGVITHSSNISRVQRQTATPPLTKVVGDFILDNGVIYATMARRNFRYNNATLFEDTDVIAFGLDGNILWSKTLRTDGATVQETRIHIDGFSLVVKLSDTIYRLGTDGVLLCSQRYSSALDLAPGGDGNTYGVFRGNLIQET